MRWIALIAVVIAVGCLQLVASDQATADAGAAVAIATSSASTANVNANANAGDANAAEGNKPKKKGNKGSGKGRKAMKKSSKPRKLTKPKAKPKKPKKPKRPPYVGGNVVFNRAMDVRGVMAAGSLVAQNATVNGTLIARQMKTKHITCHTMSVGELKTTRLSSPTGTIVIEGDLLITHSRALEFSAPKNSTKSKSGKGKGGKGKGKGTAKRAAKGISFLAEEVVVAGVKQWALVRQDHFQTPHDGWRLVGTNEAIGTSSCTKANGNDRFLGGHCVLANGPARKIFTHLPPHSQIRVTARYHFIDNWKGETGFMQVDNSYAWTQSHRIATAAAAATSSPISGIQLCGSELYPETRLSSPIDVSIPHSGDTVMVAFGAHSASSGSIRSVADEERAACERSFGVDDVSIYIR